MFRKMLIVLPALCLAAPVLAQTDAAAPAPAAKPAKAPKPKKVCRSQDFTGSRMPLSICHTEQDWADIDAGKVMHDAPGATRQYGAQ